MSDFGERIAKVVLVVALGVKIWLQLFPVDDWSDYVDASPRTAVRVAVSLVFFAAIGYFVKRRRSDEDAAAAAQEPLVHFTAAAVAIPLLINVVVLSFAQLLIVQFSAVDAANEISQTFPFIRVVDVGAFVVAGVVFALGLFLVRRYASGSTAHEAGIGIAIIGAWLLASEILDEIGVGAAFREQLFDLLVTLLVAAYALARLPRMRGREAVTLIALVLFVWLVSLRGDVITFSGEWFGFPPVVVVVLGVVWTLLSSSAFVAGDSHAFPRRGRALLWLGYLILAATILLWIDVTHGSDIASAFGDVGYIQLGIPLAAWLWLRRFRAP